MNATQCKAFMDAVEAAEITTFTFDSDLSSHFRNDGKRNIVKPDYDKECYFAVCYSFLLRNFRSDSNRYC